MNTVHKNINLKNILRFVLTLLCGILFSLPAYASSTSNTRLILKYDGKEHVYTAEPVRLVIDGRELVNLTMPPIILNDYTLVPVRETFEAMGAAVAWQPATSTVEVAYSNKIISLEIDSYTAEVDGFLKQMPLPSKIINDKTMVPLRFVSETLGLKVNWDGNNREISISSPGVAVSTPVPDFIPTPDPTPTLPTANPVELAKDVSTEIIEAFSHPDTKITDVILPDFGSTVYTIQASSPISRVDKFLLEDNRIVIDIYNASMSTSQTVWPVDNGILHQVRIGQNQIIPDKITRIVFDLKAAAAYSVGISSDRTQVYVSFEKNRLNDVVFHSDGISDYISLYMQNPGVVNVMTLTSPDRIVIDLPATELGVSFTSLPASGRYSSGVRLGSPDYETARVVIDLAKLAQYSISTEGNAITLKLSEPTFRNIVYDGDTRIITIDKKNTPIQPDRIIHTDNYNDKKYILTLPLDIESVIGYGEYKIGDDYLRSVFIQTNQNGQTEIILDERRVNAVNVYEDQKNLYIQLISPKDKYSHIVVLDPGHGGSDPGAIANGLSEKDINLDIALRIIQLIEQDGLYKVYSTKTTDVQVQLSERPVFGNEVGDLFISVHANSGDKNTSANGTEVFFYSHEFDSYYGISSKEVARIMYEHLTSALESRPRKYEHNNLAVLRGSSIPAALLEIGFLTNPEEAAKLATGEYRQKAAEAIYAGIHDIFAMYTPIR